MSEYINYAINTINTTSVTKSNGGRRTNGVLPGKYLVVIISTDIFAIYTNEESSSISVVLSGRTSTGEGPPVSCELPSWNAIPRHERRVPLGWVKRASIY